LWGSSGSFSTPRWRARGGCLETPVFDIVRERLGSRVALVNLIASFFINLLTVTAEIAGVALVLELATNVNYLAWIPLVAIMVWFVIWRVKFSAMEKLYGLLGLALIVTVVAVWKLGAFHELVHQSGHLAPPSSESWSVYFQGRRPRSVPRHRGVRGWRATLTRGARTFGCTHGFQSGRPQSLTYSVESLSAWSTRSACRGAALGRIDAVPARCMFSRYVATTTSRCSWAPELGGWRGQERRPSPRALQDRLTTPRF